MKTFQDNAGRNWTISLTLGTALLVRDKLKIDLLQPEAPAPGSDDSSDTPLLTRLGTDEMLLGEVICCLLEDQFEANKVTDADVRRAFDGRTLLAAQSAFYEELIDFFRGRGRTDRARAIEKQKQLIEQAVKTIEARIDGVDPRKLGCVRIVQLCLRPLSMRMVGSKERR
ncbi:MAG: hypothetical protein GVY24_06070, partial [Planctomycetes bacterium]|nr:hypothetical protein [Planctomycetota bacterium]